MNNLTSLRLYNYISYEQKHDKQCYINDDLIDIANEFEEKSNIIVFDAFMVHLNNELTIEEKIELLNEYADKLDDLWLSYQE